jgi:hypothetical protein
MNTPIRLSSQVVVYNAAAVYAGAPHDSGSRSLVPVLIGPNEPANNVGCDEKRVMRVLALVILAIVTSPHSPKAQAVNDEPHDWCRNMRRNADGSWAATAPINIELPNGGRVTLGATTLRERAIVINGLDVAKFVDQRCGSKDR